MFIATANTLAEVHPALRDRMEMSEIKSNKNLSNVMNSMSDKQVYGLLASGVINSDLVNEYIKSHKNIKYIISDHWKSLELIKTSKKKICLIHSKEINHDIDSKINKRVLSVLNNVHLVIANSEFTKNLAIEKGVKPELINVINPGVNPVKDLDKNYLDKAEDLMLNKSPRIITVSRFDKRKNHEKVIMAIRNLKQIYPNIIYVCCLLYTSPSPRD